MHKQLFLTEEIVEFTKKLEDRHTKNISDTVTFECEVSVKDRAIEWLKDDRVITKSDKYEIIMDGTIHRLIIHNTDGRDAGDYSARFRNRKTTASLNVEGNHIEKYFKSAC